MIFTALCLAAASCSGSAATPSAGPAGSLRVRSCYADGRIARCGTLIVPEDRLTGQGRTIPVRFAVIPATGPGRAPDPVVFFAGGPGDSAVGDIPAELPQPMSSGSPATPSWRSAMPSPAATATRPATGPSRGWPRTGPRCSLARSPWAVPAAHSPFGKPIRLDAGEFVALTHQMMMDPVTAAQLPVLIHALGGSADHAAGLVAVTRALLAAGESPQSLAGGSGNAMIAPSAG
ncbi:MAG: hypothetical protein ACLPN6_19955 [Streptosporangiaceae bacterium]|jgi:hypothetical protein|nr:hypothetical protein [Actinomycetota bacterium]